MSLRRRCYPIGSGTFDDGLVRDRKVAAVATVARVAAAVGGGSIRFAVHFYNDEEDIDRAVRALT